MRKRAKMVRRYKSKPSLSCSLLQKTLRRNHADSLRKRFPLRPISPPNVYGDTIPYLEDDEDEEDEFDDDEDDEIIDDFDEEDMPEIPDLEDGDDADADADAGARAVDDIVDMYKSRNPTEDVPPPPYSVEENLNLKYSYVRTSSVVEGDAIQCLSSTFMTDPSGMDGVGVDLGHGHRLKPVDGGLRVYVADGSDF